MSSLSTNISLQKILHINYFTVADFAETHKESDCFACVVATHGEEMPLDKENDVRIRKHVIIGTDGMSVQTKELVEMFDNCEELRGKPKLFFIQVSILLSVLLPLMFLFDCGHFILVS